MKTSIFADDTSSIIVSQNGKDFLKEATKSTNQMKKWCFQNNFECTKNKVFCSVRNTTRIKFAY